MTMTVFPRFFVLQATFGGPYLFVPKDLPANLPSGFLKFQEKQIWSPRTKFAVEESDTTGDSTLVNIRSCYNNKYWVVHKINNDYYVVASATKPQEDQTKPECTLFQLQLEDGGVHLFSPAMSMYATISAGDETDGLLISDSKLRFNVVDWETLVVLPPQVSFRSEKEGKYLCHHVIETSPHLQFESGLDGGDPHKLFPTADGSYRIKDLNSGKYWRRSRSDWIWDDGEENDDKPDDFLFSFIKISDNVFALRSLGNNTFCGGATSDGKTDCLKAQYPTILKETRLIVEELVRERVISNVLYRLSDSRIYKQQTVIISQAIVTNTSPDKETTTTLNFTRSSFRTTYWTNSSSSTFGVKVNFNVTHVPVIANNEKIELQHELGNTYQWGVLETKNSSTETTYAIVVPPSTTLKVSLTSTNAACDVPFSYTQRDLLINGEIVTTIKDDGIFTGSNYYSFSVESSKVVEDDQGRVYL